MLCVFYGEDDFSCREAIRRLADSLGDPESAALNTAFVEAEGARPAEVVAQASAVPFLGPKRLVVVNGVLSKFESSGSAGTRSRGGRSASPRRGGQSAKSRQDPSRGLDGWDNVVAAADSLPDSNTLVFSDGPVSASNPLLRLLTPAAQVRRFDRLNPDETVGWIHARSRELGVRIERDAAAALAEAAPGDLWSLDAELAKLALYAGEAPITARHVAEAGSLLRRENIFALADSVIAGQYGEARVHLDNVLREPGMTTVRLIELLGRQFRNLVMAKDLTDREASNEIAAAIGTNSRYAAQKAERQARRFTMSQLIDMHGCFLAFDLGIKTGRFEEKTGLELLLMELCAIASSRRVA